MQTLARLFLVWVFSGLLCLTHCPVRRAARASDAAARRGPKVTTNSIGMVLVRIDPGTFMMGNPRPRVDGWDEQPVHRVAITAPLWIAQKEVTFDQFRRFRPGFAAHAAGGVGATGVSWYEAVAFCRWLSKREGKPYRLPTEAEWEYAARAGTTTPFWSGTRPPKPGTANPWGLKYIHSGAREWCSDWYGPYSAADQVDPSGVASGMAKVVRGGGLDRDDAYYARAANRAGYAPAFALMTRAPANASAPADEKPSPPPGAHPIGFRVVQAATPRTQPRVVPPPLVTACVVQHQPERKQAPDPHRPWFRRRPLLPIPPDNVPRNEIRSAGLHPGMMPHNHSPGLAVCPNGDVLMIIYTSEHEYEPEVSLMGTRLRFGAEQWDMPEILFDFPDVNDHAPCLYTEGQKMFFFWGNPRLDCAYPFQWRTSTDNGAHWSAVSFPQFTGTIGPHSRQPINTVLRGHDGTLYVSSDAVGGSSVLWATKDNGKTWYDTGGRSGGRHTTYAVLKDGRLLGMGGKNTGIDGYMPKSISSDGGKTWQIAKTPFPELGSNQRPCLIRLQSGRLFFCGDFQHRDGHQPPGIRQHGSYVALSDDEGATWHIKKLVGTLLHEKDQRYDTLGYSAARQAPNGIIHLITTMNTPCLHFELNEAWILSPTAGYPAPAKARVAQVREFTETFPSGSLRARWHGGTTDTGQYVLDGDQIWYYRNGGKQWQVTYRAGRKVGTETYWGPDGRTIWSWQHREDGTSVWTQFWPEGGKKSESTWRDFRAEGPARCFDRAGRLTGETPFHAGRAR